MAKIDTEVVINDAIIASQAANQEDYQKLGQLPFVERTIIRFASIFIKRVQDNLIKANKVDTGTLSTDITEGQLIKQGSSYSLDIGYPKSSEGAKYYDFVNKGVKGFKSGQPNSPYRFRSAYPSMNGPMVNAIQKWVKRNALSSRREDQRFNLSGLQKKRKSVAQLNTGRTTAYLIARKIKQRGLPKTGFFDNAVDEVFNQQFYDKMGKAIGADLIVYIKQANTLINEENK
jgi:hypothetical protein